VASDLSRLRKLTTAPATGDHQEEFDKQVNAKHDDRGVCLLIVAQLENELDRALDHYLQLANDQRADFYDQEGPAGNFSRKIALACALGFVGPISRENLRFIRHIWNAFAKQPIKFDTAEVAAVCNNLKIINIYDRPVETDQQPKLKPRQRFENVCASTMLLLASYAGGVKEWKPGESELGKSLWSGELP